MYVVGDLPGRYGDGATDGCFSHCQRRLPCFRSAIPTMWNCFFLSQSGGGIPLRAGMHGLWHQVLTDPESYEEASCTAMFILVWRGGRHGWLENPDPYLKSAIAGWDGLTSRAIDRSGNVRCVQGAVNLHAYYKHDLSWNLNDTHGIGIVLLAGVELLEFMRSNHIVNA